MDLDDQPDVPQGHGAGAVAHGPVVNGEPDARDAARWPASNTRSRRSTPADDEWIYLPSNPRDAHGARSSTSASTRRSARPRRCSAGRQCSPTSTSEVGRRHGAGGDDSDPGKPFPTGCKTNMMTPQAKALEFLFFDLTSCVEPPNRCRSRRSRRRRARRPGRRRRRQAARGAAATSSSAAPQSQDDPRRRRAALSSSLRAGARLGGGRLRHRPRARRRRRRGLRGSSRGASGSVNENVVPAAVGAVDGDRTALRLDQALGDVEAQPLALAGGLLRLPEPFEDSGPQRRRDPGPVSLTANSTCPAAPAR